MYELYMVSGTMRLCIMRSDDHHFIEYVCKHLNDKRNAMLDAVSYWVEAV